MQVGMFKKAKGGWLQELFAVLARSPVLCKPIENTQRVWKNDIVRFELKGQEKILHPPDIAFRLDAKLLVKLRDRLERTRRTLQGVLVGDSLEAPVGSFVELRSAEEDAGAVQEGEGVFCVGVVLSRGEGDAEVQRRVKEELRRCSERSGAIYSQNSRDSALSELSRATIRQLRVFLFLDEGREGLSLGRLLYFPRASMPLRKISITQPTALTSNDVLEHIKKTMNFSREVAFGYISLNAGMAGDRHKFILLDRNDPELQGPAQPVLGVWAAGALGTGLQREGAIWSIIMEYLTDPHLSKRLSVAGERTGLFFALDNPSAKDKLTPYVFELPPNARWSISSRVENASKIPEEYAFSQQEVIMEEEREESEVESIASRQEKGRGAFEEAGWQGGITSERALEEKDAEIRRLKVELEFYKAQCEKLQEALNNINVLQLAQKTLTQQTLIPFSPPFRNQAHSPEESGMSDEPFFGSRSDYEAEQPVARVKEFAVRDIKNISFAQEHSFDEELPASSILDKNPKLTTPEFREVRDVRPLRAQDVKAFNFNRIAEDAEALKEDQRLREEQRSREEQRLREERERQKQRQRQRQKERAAEAMEKPLGPSLTRLEQKYGNYKSLSRNGTNSPKTKQNTRKLEESGRKQQSEKSSFKREEAVRRTVFEEEPRERRIKNELHSQEKEREREPRKENLPSSNITKAKNPQEVKSPEKKNSKSKSPIPQQVQKSKAIQSDEEDPQLSKILMQRKKK